MHNDIKPENMMMDKRGEAVLIDYGLSRKFVTENQSSDFAGNILFASVSQLSYRSTTRKDDLLSLAYMLIFLVNNESLPFLEQELGH